MPSDQQSDTHFSEGDRRKLSRVLRSLEDAAQRNQGVFEPQSFSKWIVFFSGSVMAFSSWTRNADRSLGMPTLNTDFLHTRQPAKMKVKL